MPTREYPLNTFEALVTHTYVELANDLGFILGGSGRRDEAERFYRQAIAIAPGVALSYGNLGIVLRDRGAPAREIIPVWERFLELSPDDPQAPLIRAELAKLRAQGQ